MVVILKTDDFTKVQSIRIKIFNKELGLPLNEIFDEDDKVLEQFLIINDGDIVGIFRLRNTNNFHKIERMGILQKHRSKSLDSLALDEIKKYSKKEGKSKIVLDSIYDVRYFYAKSGFVQIGEIYFKVGIPHINMYFDL